MLKERVLLVDIGEQVALDAAWMQTGAQLSNLNRSVRRQLGVNPQLGITRVTQARSDGKLFARFRIDLQPTSGGILVGLAKPALLPNGGANVGSDANGWSYATDGMVWNAGVPTGVGVTAGVGDIIDMAVDQDAGRVWFGRNGVWFAGGNPATGTAPQYSNLAGPLYLAVSCYGLSTAATLLVDDADVRAACPAGFTPYGNLARIASRGFATSVSDTPASVYYEGCIAADGDPIYDRRVSCVVWDRGQRSGPVLGDLELINVEGTLDYLLGYDTHDVPVRMRRGYLGDALSTYIDCAAARVQEFTTTSEERARIVFADPGVAMQRPVPRSTFAGSVPNTAVVNTSQPLALGYVRWAPLTIVDAPNLEYALADAGPFGGVVEVRDQGVVLTPMVGYGTASRADTLGLRRLTNPAGRQCASVRGTCKVISTLVSDEFTLWSGDNPVGWSLLNGPETPTVNVSQSGTAARFQSDGTKFIGIQRGVLTAGKLYAFEVVVTARVAGKIKVVMPGFTEYARIDRAGTHRGAFLAGGSGTIALATDAEVTDIIIDRFVLQEIQVIERLPDWMTELCITRAGIAADKVDIAGTITALDVAAPSPLAFFADKPVQLADLLKQTLDSFCGWYWWDRFGVLRVGRLTLFNKMTSTTTFTDIELHGPIGVEPDTAPGLSDTIAALRNYSPHETSEIAGSVQATADAGLLAAEYLIRKATTNRLASAYARARGAEPIVSLLTTETAAQALANFLASFYAVQRNFYTFSAFVDDADMAATEPGQVVTIKTDRTRRYGLKDGKQVQVVGVNSRLLSNLVNFIAIG